MVQQPNVPDRVKDAKVLRYLHIQSRHIYLSAPSINTTFYHKFCQELSLSVSPFRFNNFDQRFFLRTLIKMLVISQQTIWVSEWNSRIHYFSLWSTQNWDKTREELNLDKPPVYLSIGVIFNFRRDFKKIFLHKMDLTLTRFLPLSRKIIINTLFWGKLQKGKYFYKADPNLLTSGCGQLVTVQPLVPPPPVTAFNFKYIRLADCAEIRGNNQKSMNRTLNCHKNQTLIALNVFSWQFGWLPNFFKSHNSTHQLYLLLTLSKWFGK